ncbi:LLM class flavin-dependent oxidoreductase [Dankookia sp. GCM10030260]|uniref:LLM class flavin-dependent oxidoreductase n=1 Tax=Dankookia sp. GCM10030260 TaxID=3273390 RepID=UPI00360D9B0C
MKVALGLGLMEYSFETAAGFWRWVDLCEQAGADSLWQTDRIVSRAPILECMTMLAALAGRTRRLKFGMNVVSLAFRDPVLVAKQCATIDVLSEGRLLPAFGIGSPAAPEWAAMGLDTATRGRVTDEALEIITRLWRGESLDFAGRHFTLKGASISPQPVQPDLPVWIGGGSAAAIRRTARFGTGWQAGGETPAEAAAVIAAIRAECAAQGRVIDADHYGAGFNFHFGSPDDPAAQRAMAAYAARTGRDPARGIVAGDAAAILQRIAEYVEAGVTKFVLRPVGRGDAVPLAQTRLLLEQVLPLVAARWPKG